MKLRLKKIGTTEYKNVSVYQEFYGLRPGKIVYRASIHKLKHLSYHDDVHSAAKKIDEVLIKHGLSPVNVLKKIS